MVRNYTSNDMDLVQPTQYSISKNRVAKRSPPELEPLPAFGYRAYLSVQGIVLVVQMQDLNLCKQFIQLLVSQYEPFSCEIIIFAALSILIPISSAPYPLFICFCSGCILAYP